MSLSSLQPKPAFTLIELLVVITIIGVLTGVLILDFSGIKQRQELSFMADQSLAMLQQARAEVQAGKLRREDGIFLCEGVFFKQGQAPESAVADYNGEAGVCEGDSFELLPYGLSTGTAFIEEITVGAAGQDELWAFYSPPEGEVFLFSSDGEFLEGDATLVFAAATEIPLQVFLQISTQTDLASLSLGNEENEE
jgi:prepilin-type N-terminal cleavage/methylation domain-containing protein